MARKNRRDEYQPVDYMGVTIPTERTAAGRRETQAEYDARWDERRAKADRQRRARIARGLDWEICIVPGCGNDLSYGRGFTSPHDRRDPSLELPICWEHAATVFGMVAKGPRISPKFVDAVADVRDALLARENAERDAAHQELMVRTDGEIYFVRLNDLVKVGWTRDLHQRIRAYGASAELLVHYPATRDDETTLHRQLRPALAKGREWYEDGAIIAKFLDEALAKYGMTPINVGWTEPKRVVAGKRLR